jgi:hypothetical protein
MPGMSPHGKAMSSRARLHLLPRGFISARCSVNAASSKRPTSVCMVPPIGLGPHIFVMDDVSTCIGNGIAGQATCSAQGAPTACPIGNGCTGTTTARDGIHLYDNQAHLAVRTDVFLPST